MTKVSASIWTTPGPTAWSTLPVPMSVSRLMDAEVCPRRAALRTAEYPPLWPGRGYPSRFSVPAFVGEAVHEAVRAIVANLRRKRCTNLHDTDAVRAIMDMGGYTRVAEETVARLIARHNENPRFAIFREIATHMLRAQLPEIRRRTQALMCEVKLGAMSTPSTGARQVRRHLAPGIYSEVWLEAPDLLWSGRPDQVLVTAEGAEITEFKTGGAAPEHTFQVLVYALLWSRDRQRNPSGRPPRQLHLRYPNRAVEIPAPTLEELDNLANELTARTQRVHASLKARPPPTHYRPEECRQCEVRQMCDEYWKRLTPDPHGQAQVEEWPDVEATVLDRHGPTSFNARIECARCLAPGTRTVVRVSDARDFHPEDRLRILGAAVSYDEVHEGGSAIVRIGALTEVFRYR